MKIKWNYSGDVNMLDYGGKNIRCIGNRRYQIVELINMLEACGEDNKGQPKYNVSLRLVDLNAVKPEDIQRAIGSCGHDGGEQTDDVLAEVCDSNGIHAPLGRWNGNNARSLLRQAYQEAKLLLDDSQLEDRLEQPVNKIGSTGREFMTGDTMSAIQRGCESGSPTARLMAKMHGCPQQAIDDVRPADYLPYVMGYMAAVAGSQKETDPDTAREYFRGYERGESVKAGKSPAPTWIQQTGGQPNTFSVQQ